MAPSRNKNTESPALFRNKSTRLEFLPLDYNHRAAGVAGVARPPSEAEPEPSVSAVAESASAAK